MNSELLVIGDVSVDIYMHLDGAGVTYAKSDEDTYTLSFIHGSKVPVTEISRNLAGNACHVAVGASRLGLKTTLYSEMGKDEDGESFLKLFTDNKVDTQHTKLNKGAHTNIHTIMWYKGERTILSYHEKNNYKLDDNAYSGVKLVYYTSMAHGFEGFQKKLLEAKSEHNFVLAFNPGTQHFLADKKVLDEILAETDMLFVNKEEAQRLTSSDDDDYEALHKLLHEKGVKLSVITDGKNGASAYDKTVYEHLMPHHTATKIVDKTGAGDAFAAAFVSAIYYKKPLRTALTWGAINSAATLKYYGGVKGLLKKEQLDNI